MPLHLTRRRALVSLSASAAGIAWPWSIKAQTSIESARILCGYPAGGSVDVVCRKLAERLGGHYARTVSVDNKPGAAGRLVVDELRKSPSDGSTMLVTPASVMTMYPHIYRQLSYDVFVDVAPVSVVAVTGFVLAVGPKVPATIRTFADFTRWCRANSGSAQVGNPGAGSMPHFMAMQLARETAIDFAHIPYRGGLMAMQDAAAGQVSAVIATEASALALEQAGRLRVLATTWPERSPFFPHAPTFRELGIAALTQREWYGLFMPGRTPAVKVSAASDAVRAVLQEADLREAWQKVGLVVEGSTPGALLSELRREYDGWGPVIRASGFTPET